MSSKKGFIERLCCKLRKTRRPGKKTLESKKIPNKLCSHLIPQVSLVYIYRITFFTFIRTSGPFLVKQGGGEGSVEGRREILLSPFSVSLGHTNLPTTGNPPKEHDKTGRDREAVRRGYFLPCPPFKILAASTDILIQETIL